MSRPTAVFLPGTMCDGRVFAPQIDAAEAAGWQVRVPHLAGCRDIGSLVHSLLPRLPQRFAAIGLSFGAIAALELARQAPERVTHIALLAAHPDKLPAAAIEQRHNGFAQAIEIGLESYVRSALLPSYLHASRLPDSDQADTAVAMALDAGLAVWRDQLEMVVNRRSYLDELSRIQAPALVACGREDPVCTLAQHEQAAKLIPHAELAVLERCSHMFTLEEPAAAAILLRKLLDR